MTDVFYKELQCSICSFLFIQPRIINCGHIICLYCLTEWKKIEPQCPLCRCLIISQCRSPNIDNIIEIIVSGFPETLKKERLNTIVSRDHSIPVAKISDYVMEEGNSDSNRPEHRNAASHTYTSLFNRPEYLNDAEIFS